MLLGSFIRLKLCIRLAKQICKTAKKNYKVTVVGGAGGIGQPLGLLLKQNPRISLLAMYDVNKSVPGVGVDLSHINTYPYVQGFDSKQLAIALACADVVVLPAGLPRKPGMSRQDLFNKNAGIVANTLMAVSCYCPKALVAIITNPVNSMVPLAVEIGKKHGMNKAENQIFGVTTLDLVRAATFVARYSGMDPQFQYVPVVGGHAGATIVPLLSQANPPVCCLTGHDRNCLTIAIQEAGTEVVKAKAGAGSATLSMAFAAARFTNSLLRALSCECQVVDYAYVASKITKAPYFASPVWLCNHGIKKVSSYGVIDSYEKCLIEKAIPTLIKNAEAGVKFARSFKPEKKKG